MKGIRSLIVAAVAMAVCLPAFAAAPRVVEIQKPKMTAYLYLSPR